MYVHRDAAVTRYECPNARPPPDTEFYIYEFLVAIRRKLLSVTTWLCYLVAAASSSRSPVTGARYECVYAKFQAMMTQKNGTI